MIIPICKNAGGIVIQEAIINVADDKDMEFIKGLQSLGVNQNVAKGLTEDNLRISRGMS